MASSRSTSTSDAMTTDLHPGIKITAPPFRRADYGLSPRPSPAPCGWCGAPPGIACTTRSKHPVRLRSTPGHAHASRPTDNEGRGL